MQDNSLIRTLSSAQTIIVKIAVPVFLIFLSIRLAFLKLNSMSYQSPDSLPSESIWLVFAIWIIVTCLLLWSCLKLKRVRADTKNLYVSNYFREIEIPFSMIENVTENRWLNVHPVTIHLNAPSEFGRKITFMPKTRLFGFWTDHPVVEEIKRMARRSRA